MRRKGVRAPWGQSLKSTGTKERAEYKPGKAGFAGGETGVKMELEENWEIKEKMH